MSLKVIDGGLSCRKITELLMSFQFNVSDEKELQEAIRQIFTENNIPFEREVVLSSADKIDFMVGAIGIEVKVGFSYNEVIRQLHRYAQLDAIVELVLVTTRSQHQMPAEINGKKLTTVNLGFTNSL